MSRGKYIVVYILGNVAFILVLVFLLRSEGFSVIEKVQSASTMILNEEKIPREDITSYFVTDDFLFVNFEQHSLLNAYDAHGNFQYGIIYGDAKNGETLLGYDEQTDTLYILARGSKVYVFRETKLESFFTFSENPQAYRDIEENYLQKGHSNTAGSYILMDYGIVLTNGTSQETVVRFPEENPYIETCFILMALFNLGFIALNKKYLIH